jgi:leucyl-tRNA synthetase
MFPYPSGRIHMGHVRNYSMGDVLARFAAQGFERAPSDGLGRVRNAGRECGDGARVHPKEWTRQNIATMREQLKRSGLALDWSREFATCDVEYYTTSRRLFLDLYEAGLVYAQGVRGELGPGRHDGARQRAGDRRSGMAVGRAVERAKLTQWFLKITDYADELLTALDALDRWPEKVR